MHRLSFALLGLAESGRDPLGPVGGALLGHLLLLDRQLVALHHHPSVNMHTRKNSNLQTSNQGGSVAEWLACWTRAQKGPGSNRSRDAVGKA